MQGLTTAESEHRKLEEHHELQDALSPIYDQLSLAWFWWILELIPFRQKYQRGDNTWETSVVWNMGRGRFIPKQKKYIVKGPSQCQNADGSYAREWSEVRAQGFFCECLSAR